MKDINYLQIGVDIVFVKFNEAIVDLYSFLFF